MAALITDEKGLVVYLMKLFLSNEKRGRLSFGTSSAIYISISSFQLYKCIKKGMKHKTYVRNGLKDVQARIRKGEKGIVVFAGDVTPIEVMCHLPAVCEEKSLVCLSVFEVSLSFARYSCRKIVISLLIGFLTYFASSKILLMNGLILIKDLVCFSRLLK